jgi:F-type H+-transporting ATPase subunit b
VKTARRLALGAGALAVPLAALAAEGAPEADRLLGVPVWLWMLANLLLLIALLVKLTGKPLAASVRKRREELNEQLDRALREREEALSLARQMQERLSGLEAEVAEIRKQGSAEGEAEKAAQLSTAEADAEVLRNNSREEIERRLAAARADLERLASELVASTAGDLLSREIKDEDRRRLLADSVARLKGDR